MVKNPPANAEDIRTTGVTLGQEDPLEESMETPALVPAESHRQRSLEGYSSQGRKESDMTEAT